MLHSATETSRVSTVSARERMMYGTANPMVMLASDAWPYLVIADIAL
jgi:hypothetical protein